MRDFQRLLVTGVTPMLWGTTYLVTTTLLPPGRPLLAGLLRALPAGMLMLAALLTVLGRRALPHGAWWWRSVLLGVLNIGLFFPLLFAAAYRFLGQVLGQNLGRVDTGSSGHRVSFFESVVRDHSKDHRWPRLRTVTTRSPG